MTTSSAAAAAPAFAPAAFPLVGDPEDARAQAEARGYSAGYAAGMRQARAELERRAAALDEQTATALQQSRAQVRAGLDRLERAHEAVRTMAVPVIAEAQTCLAAAAIDLAEAILQRELATGRDTPTDALHRVLTRVDPGLVVSIRMHPADITALDSADALDIFHAEAQGLRLVADETLEPGDAVAELPDGLLDARIGSALERARRALLGEDE